MIQLDDELLLAHFFFVDVVGLSNPKNSTKTQIKKLNVLHDFIKACKIVQDNPKQNRITIPSGDGLALGFFKGPHQPLNLAIELQEKLAEYNKGKIPSELIEIRIGIHSGNVFYVNDIDDHRNVWGPGIILTRRVMDLGDAGHILMTAKIAEELRELSDEYRKIIHPIDDFSIKHEQYIPVYSVHGDGFGNITIPKKGLEQGIRKEIVKTNRETLYPTVLNKITIIDPTIMLINHKRTYEIVNVGLEPIKDVIHGIATDVKKLAFDDLKIRVYDENKNEMRINHISMNYPYQKEFSTQFNKPILCREPGRTYTLEYEVEEPERFYENAFLVDCKKFELIFEYPQKLGIDSPILYDIDQETEKTTKSSLLPIIKNNNGQITTKWIIENIGKGQTFRIEW